MRSSENRLDDVYQWNQVYLDSKISLWKVIAVFVSLHIFQTTSLSNKGRLKFFTPA